MASSQRNHVPKTPSMLPPRMLGQHTTATRGEQPLPLNLPPQQAQFHPPIPIWGTIGDTGGLSVASLNHTLPECTQHRSLTEDIVSPAEANLAQLKQTYDLLIHAPISLRDREKNFLEALQSQSPAFDQNLPERVTAAYHDSSNEGRTAERAAEIYTKLEQTIGDFHKRGYRKGFDDFIQMHDNTVALLKGKEEARAAELAVELEENAKWAEQHFQDAARIRQYSVQLQQLSVQLQYRSAQLE